MELFSTRKDQFAALEAAGVNGDAAVLIDRMLGGTQFRHNWRIEETLRMVAEQDAEASAPGTGLLFLVADLVGVGGHCGVEGDATTRIAPFSALGKGRKQASDGGAWMAAATHAAYLATHVAGDLRLVAEDGVAYLEANSLRVEMSCLPSAWRVSLTANCLRAVVQGDPPCWPGWMDSCPAGVLRFGNANSLSHLVVPIMGTTADWAVALNKALEEDCQAVVAVNMAASASAQGQEAPINLYGAIGEED